MARVLPYVRFVTETDLNMKSFNFEFLRLKWPELASLGGFAETYAHNDAVGAIGKLRSFCEQVAEWIHDNNRLPKPFRADLNDLLNNQLFKEPHYFNDDLPDNQRYLRHFAEGKLFDYIYFIVSEEMQPVKIGATKR